MSRKKHGWKGLRAEREALWESDFIRREWEQVEKDTLAAAAELEHLTDIRPREIGSGPFDLLFRFFDKSELKELTTARAEVSGAVRIVAWI